MNTNTEPVATVPWPDDPHAICERFLDEIDLTTKPNPRAGSSYFLKHLPEEASEVYVPMDALLDVAKERELPMERCDWDSPNFWLPIGKRSLRRFVATYKLKWVL